MRFATSSVDARTGSPTVGAGVATLALLRRWIAASVMTRKEKPGVFQEKSEQVGKLQLALQSFPSLWCDGNIENVYSNNKSLLHSNALPNSCTCVFSSFPFLVIYI
ncbi:hypothetical protein NC653_025381 [Populus alba x Populus x berolinensis]|uniref:Uncharacterized protein n=1 Tax=Populus alba x Populus x berolinensis TaxID=444605 RepID=A0AAD6Q9W4_9ROSI|nr:hypothetical protein NC653_025381 [Populus alba x Populus x berolinensis]